MTTDASRTHPGGLPPGAPLLLGAALVAVVLGLGLTLLGAVLSGTQAAFGALAGTLLVVGVLASGSLAVNAVAGVLPAMALLVALMTYTLQVVLLGLAFVALSASGLLDDTLDRAWLAGGVVLGTIVWLAAQVVLTTRVRIPVYDLPETPSGEAGGGPVHGREGGSR